MAVNYGTAWFEERFCEHCLKFDERYGSCNTGQIKDCVEAEKLRTLLDTKELVACELKGIGDGIFEVEKQLIKD
ncbi:MAG: hypothetical protein ABFD07_08320 [Methanobacterium sp.]